MNHALPEILRNQDNHPGVNPFFRPGTIDVIQSPALEREANEVADGVLSGRGSAGRPVAGVSQGMVQRSPSGPDAGAGVAVPPFFSGASAIPDGPKQFFESAMGRDLSNVRIHDDAAAHQSARDIHAKAYTAGNDIFFSEGRFNTATAEGKHLLAHELTHTVQQGAGAAVIQKDGDGPPAAVNAPTPEVDFHALPPHLQLRLFHFLVDADTSHVQLDYRTSSFMAGLSYQYGDALSFSMRYRDFTTRLGWTPGDNSFSLGGGTGQFNFNLTAQPAASRYGLGLTYGAPLLPSFGAMGNTFAAGSNSFGNLVSGIPAGLQNPLQFYQAHQQDITNISSTVDLINNITEAGKRRIRFGGAFSINYNPESGLVLGLAAGGIF